MDPTVDLIATAVEKAAGMSFDVAFSRVQKNQTLPDFADAVRAIGRMTFNELSRKATAHCATHSVSMKDRSIANFWSNMAAAYNKAFFAK